MNLEIGDPRTYTLCMEYLGRDPSLFDLTVRVNDISRQSRRLTIC